MEHEGIPLRVRADRSDVPLPDREFHLGNQAGHLGDARVEERRRERLAVRIVRLLEGGNERDDHRHLKVLPRELDGVGVLVRQAHLPFAEAASDGSGRGSRPASREARGLFRREPEADGVGRGRREGREPGGAGAQPDVRRKVVLARHAERRSDRSAGANGVDDRPDSLHVSRRDVPSVNRRGVAREIAELDRSPAREWGRAHADRVVKREAEDGIREAVILDQALDRMGDRGRFHREASGSANDRSGWPQISPAR